MSNRNTKIIIIGAGISGITAAIDLLSNGFKNVTILEAEGRIGGRIESVRYGNGFIDFGAQWCSGETGNSVYEMCRNEFDFGVTGFDDFGGISVVTSNGSKIDGQKLSKLYSLKQKIEELREEMSSSSESAGEFFERKFFASLSSHDFCDITDELRDMFLTFWNREVTAIYAAESWYDVSAQGFASNILCDGRQDLTWRTCGTKSLFDVMFRKFSAAKNLTEKIFLNKKVTKINWMSSGCTVSTADNSTFYADHVIVTIPLGVLQAHHVTLFSPKLPESKISAIENMKMGTLNKVFLEFEEPFWADDFVLYSFFWTKKDMKEIIGTDKEWLLNIYGFLHVDGFPNLLEALFAGNKTKEYESYSDLKVEQDCMWLLEKFLKRKLARPVAMRRTKWSSRENFLGSYAYISMTATANKITANDLGESICDENGRPILLFAGEATSSKYQGYVHGALDSGRKVAKEIGDYYGKVKVGKSKL